MFPAAAAWAETEGTVTNSERRVQRVRKALEPPGEARDDLWIICELARRMGHDLGEPVAESVWNEVRRVSPVHAGMSYARLEAEGGLQWPCYDETHPGELFLHSRLWEDPVPGNRVPFVPVEHDPPVDKLTPDFPVRLTTGRRLDSYNTGVQSGGYRSPMRRGESLDLSPEDMARYGLADGDRVRVISRRGQVEAPVRTDEGLRPGLAFMTMHFQDDVATNLLTIDATDPKSGTAEFKATAIRIEKLTGEPARLVEAAADAAEPVGPRGMTFMRRIFGEAMGDGGGASDDQTLAKLVGSGVDLTTPRPGRLRAVVPGGASGTARDRDPGRARRRPPDRRQRRLQPALGRPPHAHDGNHGGAASGAPDAVRGDRGRARRTLRGLGGLTSAGSRADPRPCPGVACPKLATRAFATARRRTRLTDARHASLRQRLAGVPA